MRAETFVTTFLCPRVVIRDGAAVDFCARGDQGIPFETLSEAQTYFYGERRAQKSFEGRKRKLLAAVSASVKKHEKRLSAVLQKRKECEGCEQNRIKGELLTANLYALTRGMKGAELENWYDGTTIKIALDERLTPAENAQSYFKRYRKARSARELAAGQKEKTLAEMALLSQALYDLAACETEQDLSDIRKTLEAAGLVRAPAGRKKVKLPESRPMRFLAPDGTEIFVGKNSAQNDRLTAGARGSDTWLHAKDMPGSHVILKAEPPSPAALETAAKLASWFSSGHGAAVPVDYTLRKYVKKPGGAAPGFVIYTHQRTLVVSATEGEIARIAREEK